MSELIFLVDEAPEVGYRRIDGYSCARIEWRA
jgi:hypothetical protein